MERPRRFTQYKKSALVRFLKKIRRVSPKFVPAVIRQYAFVDIVLLAKMSVSVIIGGSR